MEEKGLCMTCSEDKKCCFTRRSPVIYCEEFCDFLGMRESKPKKRKGGSYEFTHARRK